VFKGSGRPAARPLLSAAARPVAVVIVVVCVLVTAVLGVWLRHGTHAGWLDATVDAKVLAVLYWHRLLLAVLVWPGGPVPVTAMAAVLVLACVLRRRYHEAAFVAISVPTAVAITEFLLKPLISRTLWGSLAFPSGHVTSVAALATVVTVLLAGSPGRVPRVLRLVLAGTAFLIAATVAIGVVGAGMHYLTDTIAGAAVGTGTALLAALGLDVLRSPSPNWLHAVNEDPPMAESRTRGGSAQQHHTPRL
jgi:membrane-associated phospholipid phosphatase